MAPKSQQNAAYVSQNAPSNASPALNESGGNPADRAGRKQYDMSGLRIVSGKVTAVYPDIYCCAVDTPVSSKPLSCSILASSAMGLKGFGTRDMYVPSEGDNVLVFVESDSGARGTILGTLPDNAGDNPKGSAPSGLSETEPGGGCGTEKCYREPSDDKDDYSTLDNRAGRVLDIFPGDKMLYNELGVGWAVRRLTAHLRASEMAKIECFLPDDLVRIVSGMFQHYTDMGVNQTWNSNGLCTLEFSGSSHQCEAVGAKAYGEPYMTPGTPDRDEAKENYPNMVEDDQQPINRFSAYVGALPGIFQFFVTSPDVEEPRRRYSDLPNDSGLFHFGVDDSGRLMVRSAAEIVIRRTNKIPVPKKYKEPSDPSGKRSASVEAKIPWKWSEPGDPLSKALQLRDAEAWWDRNLYSQFQKNADEGDWWLPEESALETPPAEYDTISKHEDDYTEGEDKTCELVLRKDGGITMRDSEGAEVTMAGGKLIFTAPNGVEIRSGKSVTTLAGNDVITKARNSVDITATEHDVRIKAQENLHTTSGHSTLVECTATRDTAPDGENVGEEYKGTGVVIKASESRVSLYGGVVAISALRRVIVDTLFNAGGEIVMLAGKLIGSFKSVVLAAGESAGLTLSESSARLAAGNVSVHARSSVSVIENNRQMQTDWTPVAGTSYTNATAEFAKADSRWYDTAWLDAWDVSAREMWYFTYRTDKDLEREFEKASTDDPDPRLYESYWAYRLRKAGAATTWPEEAIHDTYPWPGAEFYENETFYFQLDSEVNIADSATNKRKPRGERVAAGGEFEGKSFNDYAG